MSFAAAHVLCNYCCHTIFCLDILTLRIPNHSSPSAEQRFVAVQGAGFVAGVQCVLLDTATSYNATVNATIVSSSVANCTLPAYLSPTGNDSAVMLGFTWPDGCLLSESFGLYPVPSVANIWPGILPRYGSWTLYLQLETRLTGPSFETVCRLLQ